MTKEITLACGLVTLVDDEDYEELSQYSWSATRNAKGKTWYAKRTAYEPGRGCASVLMHRQILGTPAGVVVDHENHNGLDNRRRNIRDCSRSQNAVNFERPRAIAPYRGLTRQASGRWRAVITSGGCRTGLGTYDTAEEAARIYDQAARARHGAFALLNFPAIEHDAGAGGRGD